MADPEFAQFLETGTGDAPSSLLNVLTQLSALDRRYRAVQQDPMFQVSAMLQGFGAGMQGRPNPAYQNLHQQYENESRRILAVSGLLNQIENAQRQQRLDALRLLQEQRKQEADERKERREQEKDEQQKRDFEFRVGDNLVTTGAQANNPKAIAAGLQKKFGAIGMPTDPEQIAQMAQQRAIREGYDDRIKTYAAFAPHFDKIPSHLRSPELEQAFRSEPQLAERVMALYHFDPVEHMNKRLKADLDMSQKSLTTTIGARIAAGQKVSPGEYAVYFGKPQDAKDLASIIRGRQALGAPMESWETDYARRHKEVEDLDIQGKKADLVLKNLRADLLRATSELDKDPTQDPAKALGLALRLLDNLDDIMLAYPRERHQDVRKQYFRLITETIEKAWPRLSDPQRKNLDTELRGKAPQLLPPPAQAPGTQAPKPDKEGIAKKFGLTPAPPPLPGQEDEEPPLYPGFGVFPKVSPLPPRR